jgi:PmbA protein
MLIEARDVDLGAALEFAKSAVDDAIAAGATQAEAMFGVADRFSTEARDLAITKLEQSRARTLQMRVFVGGRKCALATSDFDRRSLEEAIRTAVSQARYVAEDPFAALPERSKEPFCADRDLDLFSADVAQRTADVKIQEALDLERRIRRLDSRITNSSGSHVGDTSGFTVLVNSNGFSGAYRATQVHRSTSPVAIDGGAKRTGSYGTAARGLAALEPEDDVARKAVERTVGLFGARKPKTARMPVIFERDVAASVLGDIFSAVNAANVAMGNSWLAQGIGRCFGSPLVTIIDDGTIPGLLGSSPFDGEGVPSRRTVVFENGELRSFLYDTYYARKLGARSTGNSTGGGIGPNSFFLEPGAGSLEELIAQTERGILVLDTIGFATEHASGVYSRGARGFAVQNGAIAYPVEEFTIAAGFAEMLAGVDLVGADLRFDGAVVSPSFRVREMTVSGD